MLYVREKCTALPTQTWLEPWGLGSCRDGIFEQLHDKLSLFSQWLRFG
jgi:hypothetical protein